LPEPVVGPATAEPSGRARHSGAGTPAWRDADTVIDHALSSATRLAAVGVTHLTVPLDSYGLDLDGLGRLLSALHTQFASDVGGS